MRRPHLLPGRRLHDRDLPEAARGRLDRLLDRRRVDAADEGRRGDRARPGQPRRHRSGARRAAFRDYIGGNCTVSLMLMAMTGLFRAGLVEWVTAMTYQAASGAGAQNMRELIAQMGAPASRGRRACSPTQRRRILDIDRGVTGDAARARSPDRRSSGTRSPAACCPGSTRISATARARKSGRRRPRATRFSAPIAAIPMDGLCVRIGSMRCHSQALTIKLTRDVPLAEIESLLAVGARVGVGGARTTRRASLRELTPAAVTGTLAGADRPAAQAVDGRRVPHRLHRRRSAAVGRGRTAAPHAAHHPQRARHFAPAAHRRAPSRRPVRAGAMGHGRRIKRLPAVPLK